MKLYSTLDRKVVDIVPIKEGQISMYNCGPTVYYRMHLGNIRAYVSWDILHRALLHLGYDVKRVMNFTDVGHMTHDEDFGEDKMDIEAKKEGLQAIDIANKYINTVLEDFKALNILTPNGEIIEENLDFNDVEKHGWMRATAHIAEIIETIKKIELNGYTYETENALYFDVTKIPDYTIFTGQKLEDKKIGDREEVVVDPNKKNPADFVLWMKKVGKYENHEMLWNSPWGDGFPGWHIECSAMGTKALGENFDIHTGGVDHIPVHHTNERAQNIGAFGHGVVKYWVHNEWVVNKDDAKLSKSDKNADTLLEIVEKGFDPLDIRYLFASVNYHTKLAFSTEALVGARNARLNISKRVKELGTERGNLLDGYIQRFKDALENNLNMSEVLSILNELLKSSHKKEDILATVLDFDKVLGLGLDKIEDTKVDLGEDIEEYAKLRDEARANKDYAKADEYRKKIEDAGYIVLDTPQGTKYQKK
ncbi:MAG TPA: cysteine--tRNA ligase [Candidatus Dojkabacteria bacterium]|nr:cysteine--tRNA ligase [Candidatus Dojkabacteria bacterium]HOR05839.1 cysteine--tRNA ligase [Candidatus Dojkabacteria bacterium]